MSKIPIILSFLMIFITGCEDKNASKDKNFGSYSADGQVNKLNFIMDKCVLILKSDQVPSSNTCDLKEIISKDASIIEIVQHYDDNKVTEYVHLIEALDTYKISYAINSIGNVQVFYSYKSGCNMINEYSKRNNKYFYISRAQNGCDEVLYTLDKQKEKLPDKGYSEVFIRNNK
jgi:hypothetical protein